MKQFDYNTKLQSNKHYVENIERRFFDTNTT